MNSIAWTDMSDFVVHFTKKYEGKDAYDNMLSILGNGVIEARNPFGIARKHAPQPSTQNTVCFSEIPLHLLERLAAKRSEYGIVFKKDFIIQRQGNPVFYAYKGLPVTEAIQKLYSGALSNPLDPIWELTPFVDAPGQYAGSYFFEWEREWRKVGDLHFEVDDVAFLIIPEALQTAAKGFFESAKLEDLGPSYTCPFIDAYWSIEQIEPLLKQT